MMAACSRRDPDLAWKYVDLDVIALLSFEGPRSAVQSGVGARAHLENSIAAYMVFFLIKRIRAHGGCLGAKRRRRTWAAAISPEEVLTDRRSRDVRMGKPTRGNARVPVPESIACEEASWGTETSKYPEERKETSTP